jgi:hypothetical protein
MNDEAELEGSAVWAYRAAGLDPDKPRIIELARRLVGPVMTAHGISLPGDASLDDGRILVRARTTGWRLRFAIAHEVAEHLLVREGVQSEQQEELADRLAASLLAPQPIAYRVCRFYGPKFEAVATELRVHAYSAVLRFGEVTRVPTELRPQRGALRARGEPWPRGAVGESCPVGERVARWVG